MDTDVHSQKRPLSPVSESEGTDTDASGRTRPRLEEQPSTEQTTLDPGIRDRSPLRPSATGTDSTSDSSGKSLTSNASVIVPPAAQLAFPEEPSLLPPSSLDRRPLSTRYREYCSTAPEYTAVEAEELVLSMLEAEHELESLLYATTGRHWSSSRITTTCSWIESSPSPLVRPLRRTIQSLPLWTKL